MKNSPSEWHQLLSKLNSMMRQSDPTGLNVPPEVFSTGWSGSPPASNDAILKADQRLGQVLPPSYRCFLSVTNGWFGFGSFVDQLFSVEQIDWFRILDPEALRLIQENYKEDKVSDEMYLDYENNKNMTALRHRYYPECLLVGNGFSGGELILLNPKVISSDREWEAIFFANWFPGNQRYRSFLALVEAIVKSEGG